MKLHEIKVGYQAFEDAKRWAARNITRSAGQPETAVNIVDGEIVIGSSARPLIIDGVESDQLPYKVAGSNITVNSCKQLTSLRNLPEYVENLRIFSCHGLKTFEGFPRIIEVSLGLGTTGITSCQGIERHIEHIGNKFYMSKTVNSHLLGLLKIKGDFIIDIASVPEEYDTLRSACMIINKHLRSGRAGILAAQQEMLDAGLDDFAQL